MKTPMWREFPNLRFLRFPRWQVRNLPHLPPMKKAGKTLLWCVNRFGVATILFGLSRIFWFPLAMLFLTAVFDSVSVIVRHTLIQLLTPDEMRGRISA
jgi:hypothetical protein